MRRLLALGFVITLTASGCGLLDTKHKVGECVHTRTSLGGTDITSTDCPTKKGIDPGSFTNPVYKITAVLDYEQSCPNGRSFGGIELKHEPDDAVYCLALAAGL
ncbi:hypothetical protein JNUCC0626_26785 [Lentzea sp. JNUCC 0626]|uniref:hypothetical protein n=1 Tax=Lentzea sp. JNUCC 0626 TaxID=3367513 RepID=UPI003748CC45